MGALLVVQVSVTSALAGAVALMATTWLVARTHTRDEAEWTRPSGAGPPASAAAQAGAFVKRRDRPARAVPRARTVERELAVGVDEASVPSRSVAVTVRSVVETMSVWTVESLKPSRSHSSAETPPGRRRSSRGRSLPSGDVGVAERAADVLVVEGLGHEAGDPREAPVGERELADLVGALGRDHLGEHAARSARRSPRRRARRANSRRMPLHEVAVAVERLVEARSSPRCRASRGS